MMKLSVFHHHVIDFAKKRGIDIREALAETRAMGFDGLVTDLALLADGDRLHRLFTDNGLGLHSIFAGIDFVHDEPAACARRTEELLNAAMAFGAGSVLVLPGLIRDGDDRDAGLDRICGGLSEACRLAAPLGIDVTIEDFGFLNAPNGTIAGCAQILDRVPELKFTFDTGNFTCFGEDPHVAYGRFRDRTVFVHLKDRPSGPDGKPDAHGAIPVGDGALDLGRLVRRMLADGYTGGFAAEHFEFEDQEAAMRRSAVFCRRILSGGEPNASAEVR